MGKSDRKKLKLKLDARRFKFSLNKLRKKYFPTSYILRFSNPGRVCVFKYLIQPESSFLIGVSGIAGAADWPLYVR